MYGLKVRTNMTSFSHFALVPSTVITLSGIYKCNKLKVKIKVSVHFYLKYFLGKKY